MKNLVIIWRIGVNIKMYLPKSFDKVLDEAFIKKLILDFMKYCVFFSLKICLLSGNIIFPH